jgi:hypothetical protein
MPSSRAVRQTRRSVVCALRPDPGGVEGLHGAGEAAFEVRQGLFAGLGQHPGFDLGGGLGVQRRDGVGQGAGVQVADGAVVEQAQGLR